jgi:hypothetical protein
MHLGFTQAHTQSTTAVVLPNNNNLGKTVPTIQTIAMRSGVDYEPLLKNFEIVQRRRTSMKQAILREKSLLPTLQSNINGSVVDSTTI